MQNYQRAFLCLGETSRSKLSCSCTINTFYVYKQPVANGLATLCYTKHLFLGICCFGMTETVIHIPFFFLASSVFGVGQSALKSAKVFLTMAKFHLVLFPMLQLYHEVYHPQGFGGLLRPFPSYCACYDGWMLVTLIHAHVVWPYQAICVYLTLFLYTRTLYPQSPGLSWNVK